MRLNLILGALLIAAFGSAAAAPAGASNRQAVIYYNAACDECLQYVEGELRSLLAEYEIPVVSKDYINQPENRRELNDLNDRLGVPLDLQSHLATYIDDGRLILMGEPPAAVVRALLARAPAAEPRLLIYSEEGGDGAYQAWAFAGPIQSYAPGTDVETYLSWFEANRASFPAVSGPPADQTLLLSAVLLTGLIDGINPCAMAILLFFITFLLSIRKNTTAIVKLGAVYILAVYSVYFLVGLGLLRASNLVQGHWLGQAGAVLLMFFGLVNLLNGLFPKFPLRLELPEFGKEGLKQWMYRATLPAALVLGSLMGLESFPCSGGPYVAILGLLASQADFWQGLAYLALYNLMFVLPLILILGLSLNPLVANQIQAWERRSSRTVRAVTGGLMAALGLGLLVWVL